MPHGSMLTPPIKCMWMAVQSDQRSMSWLRPAAGRLARVAAVACGRHFQYRKERKPDLVRPPQHDDGRVLDSVRGAKLRTVGHDVGDGAPNLWWCSRKSQSSPRAALHCILCDAEGRPQLQAAQGVVHSPAAVNMQHNRPR